MSTNIIKRQIANIENLNSSLNDYKLKLQES